MQEEVSKVANNSVLQPCGETRPTNIFSQNTAILVLKYSVFFCIFKYGTANY